jgi:hypothetical protein
LVVVGETSRKGKKSYDKLENPEGVRFRVTDDLVRKGGAIREGIELTGDPKNALSADFRASPSLKPYTAKPYRTIFSLS